MSYAKCICCREYRNVSDEGLCEHCAIGVDDDITNPNHYTWIPGIECKDVVKHMEWAIGNAVKYLWRCNHKGNREKDINKAIECCKIALTTKKENKK